jgi:DNA-binding NarL/FixJ family response regulator
MNCVGANSIMLKDHLLFRQATALYLQQQSVFNVAVHQEEKENNLHPKMASTHSLQAIMF